MNKKHIFLYTAQSDIVLKTIREEEHYSVKKEYLQAKYQEITPIILKAYDWFKCEFKKCVTPPADAQYPVWLFVDKRYAKVHESHTLLELKIPQDKIILFDNTGWEKVLSLDYVPKDKADKIRFDKLLKRYQLDCGFRVFEKPFYPNIKLEIVKSWLRIFNIKHSKVLRAASWEIRKEWVQN